MLFRGKTVREAIAKATDRGTIRQATDPTGVSDSEWNSAVRECEALNQRMTRVMASALSIAQELNAMEREMQRLNREQLEVLAVLGLNVLTVRAWRSQIRSLLNRLRNIRDLRQGRPRRTGDALDQTTNEVRRLYLAMSTIALWNTGLSLSRELRVIKNRYYPLVRNLDGQVDYLRDLARDFRAGRCQWVLRLAEATNQPLARRR